MEIYKESAAQWRLFSQAPRMRTLSIPRRAITLMLFISASVVPMRSVETAVVVYDVDGTAKYADITWNSGPVRPSRSK
jgi:hypothetical protein